MNVEKTMAELEKLGTAQYQKVYARHGVTGDMFGVSYANMGKLRKKIKTNHELAQDLWASGNHDARVLATMVADPEQLDDATVESWASDLDNYVLTDALSGLVGRSPLAESKMTQWTQSSEEWRGAAGWNLLARLAMSASELPDSFFTPYLQRIEDEIHSAENRVRYSMNNALIAIGIRNKDLKQLAQEAAKTIGPVQVDHGETSCKTPDAVPYIDKAWKRKLARAKS